MKLWKLLSSLCLSFLLAACGGGGGEDPFAESGSEDSDSVVNNIPELSESCATSLTQDLPFACSPSVSDPDSGDSHSWSFGASTTCDSWIGIHPSTGEIAGVPLDSAVGTCDIEIAVEDSSGQGVSVIVELTVANLPPTLNITNAANIAANSPATVIRGDFDVQANEEGQGVYSLVGSTAPDCAENGSVVVNSVNGQVTYTPAPAYQGTCNVTVMFDDENGEANSTVSDSFSVQVISNAAPAVNVTACTTNLNQDVAYACSPVVTDPDVGDTHTWSTATGHDCLWLSLNPTTGELTGTPNDDNVGNCEVRIVANDGFVDSPVAPYSIQVDNIVPTLTIANAPNILEDSSANQIRLDNAVDASEEGFGAYDFDNATTTAPRCVDNGTALVHPTNGAVTFSPVTDYSGTCNFKVEFDDGNGGVVADEFSVTVIESNDQPVVNQACATTGTQEVAYSCSPTVTDPDGGAATWALDVSNTCVWASIDGPTGAISGTPGDNDVGLCTLAFKANDTFTDSDVASVSISIDNTAPTLTIADAGQISRASPATEIRADGDVQANEEGLGVYSVGSASSDPCEENGTVVVDNSTGAVTYTPTPSYVGTCNISIVFDDENGEANSTVTAEFSVEVAEIPPVLTGLADDPTPRQSMTWNWGCNTTCEYRHVVNNTPTHTFTTEPYGATLTATQSSGTDTYYLHIQARDTNTALETSVETFSAIVDNTVPTDPSNLVNSGTMTETTSDTLSWDASIDETELNRYEIAVGTTPGGTDVADWTSVGNVASAYLPGLTIAVGTPYYSSIRAVDTAGNMSAEVQGTSWILPGPPSAITNLSITSPKKDQITIGWAPPADNGRAITDYFVEFKLSSAGSYAQVADGVSTDTTATISGLTPETSYDFRVIAYNGASAPYSNIATGETLPDDPFFEADVFKAMNLGGATDSAVAAMEDGTEIKLNDVVIANLDAGETHSFSSTLNDLIEGDKPIFVAGRKGNAGAGANYKGNMVWSSPDWAGKNFIFTGTRNPPHLVNVYSFNDNNTVTVTKGATQVDQVTLNKGDSHSFSLNSNGGFQMSGSGNLVAHMHSSQSGRVIDPKPLLPAATDLIGIPSRTVKITTIQSSNAFSSHHSDGFTNNGTLNSGSAASVSSRGTIGLYRDEALRIISTTPAVGNSNADANGYCSAPFVPVGMMKKRYVINVEAEWVAFASLEPGTIDMIEPGTGTVTQLTLTQTGSNPNAPYKAYTTNKAAGYRFTSTIRFQAYYEPKTDVDGAEEDETVMFGAD